MKDSITLTRKQFDLWIKTAKVGIWFDEPTDKVWQSLVEESQKPERIVRWGVVMDGCVFLYRDEQHAREQLNSGKNSVVRLIKLVEEVPNDPTR